MIRNFQEQAPQIAENAFVAESAQIIGAVTVGENSSIWYGAVLRGDDNSITIGACSNIQDNCVLHITTSENCVVGDYVTVGHSAILHGCTVGNEVLVGMGSSILNGAVVEDQVIIGAGTLIPPGKRVPSRSLVVGSPAKVVRDLTDEEIKGLKVSAENYALLAQRHSQGGLK